MDVEPDGDEPQDSELCVALVECRLRCTHGREFFIRFTRIGNDGPRKVIGLAGPYNEQSARQCYEKWIRAHAESIAHGQPIMILDMDSVPQDARRLLEGEDSDG
jgi:hypothetical protein